MLTGSQGIPAPAILDACLRGTPPFARRSIMSFRSQLLRACLSGPWAHATTIFKGKIGLVVDDTKINVTELSLTYTMGFDMECFEVTRHSGSSLPIERTLTGLTSQPNFKREVTLLRSEGQAGSYI